MGVAPERSCPIKKYQPFFCELIIELTITLIFQLILLHSLRDPAGHCCQRLWHDLAGAHTKSAAAK